MSCSSPAWKHVPQVLHEVAVDGAETLTVNVRLHDRVDKKTSAVRLPDALASCSVFPGRVDTHSKRQP